MSFQRFSACHKLFSHRKNIILHHGSSDIITGGFKRYQNDCFARLSHQKTYTGQPYVEKSYSTSTKPHLSRSLQKWKMRKRKSKAQQKRELETLQKDFTQLLTKRVVQLIQEDSYRSAHRRVVSTHNFTSSVTPHITGMVEGWTAEMGSRDGNVKLSDEFIKKLDTHVQSMMHLKEMDRFKNVTALPEMRDLMTPKKLDYPSGLLFTNTNESKPLINQLVQNYLKDKDYKDNVNAATESSRSTSDLRFSSAITASDVYSPSHKDTTSVKPISYISPESFNAVHQESTTLQRDQPSNTISSTANETKGVLPQPASSPQKSNDFLNLFLKFQEGVKNSGHRKRSWERLGEEKLETTTVCAEPLRVESSVSTNPSQVDVAPIVKPIEIEIPTTGESEVPIEIVRDSLPQQLEFDFDLEVPTPEPVFPQKGKSATSSKVVHVKKSQRKKEHKDFQELIDKSFVDACCFTGNELLAVRNLEFQSNRHGLCSVDVVNRLIHALAKKKNLEAIKSLFSLLRQGDVSPSLQTYVGCLECIGRMAEPDSFLCERLIADVENAGFELAEVANACNFESDEWDYVLKAIHLVNPDFIPNSAPEAAKYANEMLLPLEQENPKRVEHNQYAIAMSKRDVMKHLQRQMEMEKQGEVVVPSIARQPKRNQDEKLKKLQEEVLKDWKKALCDSFTEKLKTYEKKAQNNMNMTVYPYLKLFPPELYVEIIFKSMQDLFSSSEAYSPTQVMFQSSMGRAVNRMYNIRSQIAAGMEDKVTRLYEHFAEEYLDAEFALDNHRKMWTRSMALHYDTINMDMSMKKWPRHVTKTVGKILLDLILYDLKINANLFKTKSPTRLVPAFCTIYRPDVTTFTMAEIKLHPVVSKLFKMETMEEFHFDPSTVPMVVPPVPWISKNTGGLLLGSYALVRSGDDLYHLDALKNVKDTQYTAVLDSLNTLSACAWKMNKKILDLQIQIFKGDGDPRLKVSPPASVLPPLPTIKADMCGQEKAAVYRQRLQLQHQKQDMHGLWCSDLYRLSIANKFRDETFWFPHSMDFRGRTYPLPPHFNHLGSDNVRGMLLFAKGKPLGPKGHDWLKIHLINLTGLKKRSSNDERLAYADSILEEVMDSADNPLTGRGWWQESDEPWQTLACCMELAEIERFDGADKQDYVCHFPVHQDGSCNGLQHYAAIGRDQAGAESVNLVPFDTPQDVYSDVVELVERERKKDAEEGDELAKALEGIVKRKVIKQTIMTTVYGVTRFGAKAQIHKQLKDVPDFPSDLAWKASFYLTEKTFSSLQEMFAATKDIQDWLTELAQRISAVKPVDWVTPLGFPVVQPYFKRCSDVSRNKYTSKPNAVKQKNAFPPNYIHSLDSTHMMLTSLYCMHAGITFVSVHDCFWTHACDVPAMNRVCREQFVRMHEQPLLEDLSRHLLELVRRASLDPALQDDFKKIDYSALQNYLSDVPKRGTFDLKEVLESTYFFS